MCWLTFRALALPQNSDEGLRPNRSDEGLMVETSANTFFMVFSISTSTFHWYSLCATVIALYRRTLVLTGTTIPFDKIQCLSVFLSVCLFLWLSSAFETGDICLLDEIWNKYYSYTQCTWSCPGRVFLSKIFLTSICHCTGWYVGSQVGAVVIITTVTWVQAWVRTWTEIGWSQFDSEGFSPSPLVFLRHLCHWTYWSRASGSGDWVTTPIVTTLNKPFGFEF